MNQACDLAAFGIYYWFGLKRLITTLTCKCSKSMRHIQEKITFIIAIKPKIQKRGCHPGFFPKNIFISIIKFR